MASVTYGSGEKDDPWILKTPSLTSDYQAWRDEAADPPALVVQVGATRLSLQIVGHPGPCGDAAGPRRMGGAGKRR